MIHSLKVHLAQEVEHPLAPLFYSWHPEDSVMNPDTLTTIMFQDPGSPADQLQMEAILDAVGVDEALAADRAGGVLFRRTVNVLQSG